MTTEPTPDTQTPTKKPGWFIRHWQVFFIGSMLFLLGSVLFGVFRSQQAKEAVNGVVRDNVLNKRQVKAQDKTIGKLQDSIQVTTIYVDRIIHQRDSVRVIAKQASARADSAVKILSNESTPDSDVDPSRLTRSLSDYRPQAYLTPDGDSLK